MTFAALAAYGWGDRWAALLAEIETPGAVPGRVVRHDGVALSWRCPTACARSTSPARLDPPPTVGDWVVVDGDVPVAVLPRTSLLTRRAAVSDAPQQLAANVDGVLVVCGLDRPVKPGRIDRVVTLAWDAGAVPDGRARQGRPRGRTPSSRRRRGGGRPPRGRRASPPRSSTATASTTCRALVAGRTVVLVGESGAGKSSLTNVLLGDDVMATGDVRAGDAKGRHTTTTREAHPLPGGGVLIDTPGLRVGGPVGRPRRRGRHLRRHRRPGGAAAGSTTAATTASRAARCQAALADGHAGRRAALDGWQALEREAAAAELRAAPHLLRARNRQFGRIAKDAQRRKGRPEGELSQRPRLAIDAPTAVAGAQAELQAAERLELEAQVAHLDQRGVHLGRRWRPTRRSTVIAPRCSTSQPANPAVRRPRPRHRNVISATSGIEHDRPSPTGDAAHPAGVNRRSTPAAALMAPGLRSGRAGGRAGPRRRGVRRRACGRSSSGAT